MIIAHRGASGLGPENTLAAFEAAIAAGADGIELDVHLTADGHVVVHHDYCINKEWARLDGAWLDETGPAIRDLTLAEVQSYDVGRLAPGSAYHAKYPDLTPADGAVIPTLRSVLDLVKARAPADFQIWLELKLAPPYQAPTSDAIALAYGGTREFPCRASTILTGTDNQVGRYRQLRLYGFSRRSVPC